VLDAYGEEGFALFKDKDVLLEGLHILVPFIGLVQDSQVLLLGTSF